MKLHKGSNPKLMLMPTILPDKESIVAQRIVRMNYHAQTTDKPTTRQIEPMWLIYYGPTGHLIGYCRLREDIRDFRLDRIKRAGDNRRNIHLREQYKLEE